MNRNERYENQTLALLTAMEGHQKEVWTALPGIIQSFDPVAMTCTVKPAILIPLKDPETAAITQVDIPVLLDVPVIYPSGGGFTLTFPIVNGDECLVIFSSRCIDTWWQNGGYKNQLPLLRMNDLSDGFALVGPRSQVRTISAISSANVQLRTDSGETYVEITPDQHINLTAPAGSTITTTDKVTINAPNGVIINGNLTVNGLLTGNGGTGGVGASIVGSVTASGEGTFNGHTVGNHRHGGVQPGSGTSALPTG